MANVSDIAAIVGQPSEDMGVAASPPGHSDEPASGLAADAGSVPNAWRCFHCDDVFDTREAAAEHFGEGNYENEMPLCIEAATSEMRAIVLTNREMFEALRKAQDGEEQAEFVAHCWEQAARMFLGKPNANWHDLANHREDLEGRALAAETALNAAPRWLASWLRRRAERKWRAAQGTSPREG